MRKCLSNTKLHHRWTSLNILRIIRVTYLSDYFIFSVYVFEGSRCQLLISWLIHRFKRWIFMLSCWESWLLSWTFRESQLRQVIYFIDLYVDTLWTLWFNFFIVWFYILKFFKSLRSSWCYFCTLDRIRFAWGSGVNKGVPATFRRVTIVMESYNRLSNTKGIYLYIVKRYKLDYLYIYF